MAREASDSSGRARPRVVPSKLRAPGPAPHHVRRGRLLDHLDEAVAAPLTLVVAPAGAGKTSLLAAWVAAATGPTAWLSLDGDDGDPTRLWDGVVAALDPLVPGCGRRARRALRRGGAGPDADADAVRHLLDEIDDRPQSDAVLVIDDAHLVDAAPVAESLSLFLQHLPRWLHAVVLSRRDPALPLDRLRVRGALGEIRFPELRFTPGEARAVLARLAPSLTAEQVDVVVDRADGWAAILDLVARAARAPRAGDDGTGGAVGDDPGAPAADGGALVHDYVTREVLAGEPREVVDALADVAVVDRVGPSLARALTGRPDADDLLRRAEARGLLVTRLPAPGCFEAHRAMRSALVAEATARAPERLAARHERAARWYEEAGDAEAALDHWLRAGRPRQALQLLATQHVALHHGGQGDVVQRTLAAIPPEVAGTDVTAMAEHAWCHLLLDRHRFLELVDATVWWAGRSGVDGPAAARLTLLRAIGATVGGRSAEGGRLARRAMAGMAEGWWRDPLGRVGWNVVACEVALFERWGPAVDEVRQAERALSRDPEGRLVLEGTRALGEALAGRPVDALRVEATVRNAATAAGMTTLAAELGLARAIAHRELGDPVPVLADLRAVAENPAGPLLVYRIMAAVELVQAHLDRGAVGEAGEVLARAEALVAGEAFGPDAFNRLARAGVLVALAEGAVDRARACAERVDDPFWAPVSTARVELACGGAADAATALASAVPRCPRHVVVRDLLLARSADGRDEAVRRVTAAVERAVGLGLLQTVAAEGPDVVHLVERAAWRAPQGWMDRLRRAAMPSAGGGTPPTGDGVETLTTRERDVLRLLAGRLTVREIAGELYVSPNTLKFHLKTIYRKLGVGSRAEAADIARQMAALRPAG